eukprot:gnl/MRDRNA2_/MRDRNA2_40277_c0_seq2.p1 gnl/MRDRNA2_/MRDRNA2_40277_c0~~gnl/MRDRNA2_/MRDRNA2_40277_c0_seq2.p1  ORF type:complete len:439 (-),score=68.52 gnl/MRDRNA2_/MRDRNA2_40277_c0_seq2:495-1700(-)
MATGVMATMVCESRTVRWAQLRLNRELGHISAEAEAELCLNAHYMDSLRFEIVKPAPIEKGENLMENKWVDEEQVARVHAAKKRAESREERRQKKTVKSELKKKEKHEKQKQDTKQHMEPIAMVKQAVLRNYMKRNDTNQPLADNILVVNKPFDVRINRDFARESWFPEEVTVADWYLDYVQSMDGKGRTNQDVDQKVRFCHQIDRGTSGLLTMAHTQEAAAAVCKQFWKRDAIKMYHAIVLGWISCPNESASKLSADYFLDIEIPIQVMNRTMEGRRTRCVSPEREGQTHQARDNMPSVAGKVKSACTRIWPLQRGYYHGLKCTFVKVQIFTGRMHQIRVHLAHVGHPILGDKMYGEKQTPPTVFRMFLHAYNLKFPELGLSYTSDSGFAALIKPEHGVQ